MNYNSEDGSSILNRGTEVEQANLTTNENNEKTEEEKAADFSNIEKFHEDTLLQVDFEILDYIINLIIKTCFIYYCYP